jgi:hypothetical protein
VTVRQQERARWSEARDRSLLAPLVRTWADELVGT